MGDGLVFYLVLLVLAAEESSANCGVWELFFRGGIRGGWAFCGTFARKRSRGLALLAPPFLGQPFLAREDCVSFCGRGVGNLRLCAFPLERGIPGEVLFFEYGEICGVSVREALVAINGRPFVKCADEKTAEFYAGFISRLAAADAEARRGMLREYLDRRFDMSAAGSVLDAAKGRLVFVRALSLFQFFAVFALFPAAYAARPSAFLFLVLLAAGSLLSLACAAACAAVKAGEGGGWKLFALKCLLFFPFVSVICREIFWRKLEDFHPALVACLTLEKSAAAEYLRGAWRDLRHPVLRSEAHGPAVECARAFNAMVMEKTEALAVSLGVDEMEIPPSSVSADAVCYCPRCGASFVSERERCSDCSCRLVRKK